jgi:hypothetical protein
MVTNKFITTVRFVLRNTRRTTGTFAGVKFQYNTNFMFVIVNGSERICAKSIYLGHGQPQVGSTAVRIHPQHLTVK